jgi:hypothetical protein
VNDYRVVINGADRTTANAARLTAATMLQQEGKDQQAERMFAQYLDNAVPGDAAALLKLGRQQISSGRRTDARATLERVISLGREAREAQDAAKLLKTLK